MLEYKIGIICAGDEELKPFLPYIENCVITEKSMLKVYEGTIGKLSITALFSGVCKVNAALATQILINEYNSDIIINSGVCGGLDNRLKVLDTVVSTQVCYHDVSEDILTEFHPWMNSTWFFSDTNLINLSYKVSNYINNRVFFGKTVTGESFVENKDRVTIHEKFKALSVDMETAAIAHACYINKVPFIAIRTVTDTAEYSGIDSFEINCRKASEISRDFTLALICEIENL